MKQMIVHCSEQMTRMALLDEGKLVEYAAEHGGQEGLVGSYYKGRVINVLPGMQAAFVDIGQKKNAFLYIDDVLHPHLEKQPLVKPSIDTLLHPGQEIVVQVRKEPRGGKGARVTTHYTLPGRWMVYMPSAEYVGVSKKIVRDSERNRLKALGERLRKDEEGLIMRTVAEDEPSEAVEGDLELLRAQWKGIMRRAAGAEAPALLHRDLSIVQRFIRDAFDPKQDELIIDSAQAAKEAEEFLEDMAPGRSGAVKLDETGDSVFVRYRIWDELNRSFARKIMLDGGGTLIWDETEAFTVIDVNTAQYTGGSTLEETVTRTNLLAAEEIGRLIRLRDTGGIIIVDFIDMEQEEHRRLVTDRLESVLAKDRTKTHILGWTRLGLLEMTRKKARQTSGVVQIPCPCCGGTGRSVTPDFAAED
ncbi:Rne/Rng family ribonuclease [Paenibacillus sp. HN-1]|uniref:Rne/Rng family ribonuclease n=1 Tax=Paenibacillus TaxID=44249 RepID=UPI001CA86CB9|nr:MULTISPECIES: Rne/Rng family ribonuclease [Paenibacillus]MBY9079382.1 Rne/Rng family ribonuclease [Paenibacillus sp. CGMCC 1.18879]MBY9085677.1 Rne/Rng family ribonuclease [Paenibacillus sinensis]